MSVYAKKKETHVDNGTEYNKYTVLSESQDDTKELAESSDLAAIAAKLAVTEYYYTDSTTATSSADSMIKNFTADGDGFVIASCSVQTDNSSNYGTTTSRVYKNGTTYGYSSNRFPSATTAYFGANAVAAMKVSQGDVIELSCYSSKAGTKKAFFNVLAIGCTMTVS